MILNHVWLQNVFCGFFRAKVPGGCVPFPVVPTNASKLVGCQPKEIFVDNIAERERKSIVFSQAGLHLPLFLFFWGGGHGLSLLVLLNSTLFFGSTDAQRNWSRKTEASEKLRELFSFQNLFTLRKICT